MEKNTVVRLAIQVSALLPFNEFCFSFFSPSCGKRSVRMVLKTKIQMLAGSKPSIFDNLPLFSGTWQMCSFIWFSQSSSASLANTTTGRASQLERKSSRHWEANINTSKTEILLFDWFEQWYLMNHNVQCLQNIAEPCSGQWYPQQSQCTTFVKYYSGQWYPPCTAPPLTTLWWCKPMCSLTQAKKTFISGKHIGNENMNVSQEMIK